MIRTLSVVGLGLLATFACSADEPVKHGFQTVEFTNEDGTKSPYDLFIPHGYDGSKPVPVILFLHGSGESKGGKIMPVQQGIGNHIKGKREKAFPAIVIFPQSEKRTWAADSADSQRAMLILEEVQSKYKTDPDRVYLSGLSMGGYGTWGLAAKYPDKWAAIVPICGGGTPADAEKFAKLPCWAFHGDEDKAVPVSRSRDMIEALKKAGGKPKYTEYPGVAHNSWDPAYGTDELYEWLFAQKRGQ